MKQDKVTEGEYCTRSLKRSSRNIELRRDYVDQTILIAQPTTEA